MAKKRKKVSGKVLAALARGRAKLKKLRGSKTVKRIKKAVRKIRRKVSATMEPIIIQTGESKMAKRRKHTRKKSSIGIAGKRKHTRRKSARLHGEFGGKRVHRRRRMSGDFMGADTKGMTSALKDGLGVTVGAVGGSMVTKYVPVPQQFKAIVPIALGVLLGTLKATRKLPMMKSISLGMIAAGGIGLTRQFAPQLLAGDEELLGAPMLSADEAAAMLGESAEFGADDLDNLGGESAVFADDLEMQGEFKTPASM